MIKIKNLIWPLTRRKLVIGSSIAALLVAGGVYLAFFAPKTVTFEEHRQFQQRINQLNQKKDFAEIERQINDYLKKKRLNQDLLYDTSVIMAVNYVNLGNQAAALEWYQKAEGIDEDRNANITFAIGKIYYEMGQVDKAIAYYKKGIEIVPRDRNPYNDPATPYEAVLRAMESGQPFPEDRTVLTPVEAEGPTPTAPPPPPSEQGNN